MADREKVMKGLECKLTPHYETCKDCQYFEEELAEDYPEFEYFCNRSQIEADALFLLKAQEPIAPKLIKMYPHDIYECGNCKHRSVGSKDYKAKYCPECGVAVKWE